MPDFGDFEADDAFDIDTIDYPAAARILLAGIRRRAPDQPGYDDLHPWLAVAWAFELAAFLARLRLEGTA